MSAPRGDGARLRSLGGCDAGARERAGRHCVPEERQGGGPPGEESGAYERGGSRDLSFTLEGVRGERF